jgi:mono/diheme cytochrome c family protein
MNLRRGCVGGLIGAVVWVALPAARGAQEPAASPPPPRAVFDKYCVGCHNQRVKTAGLALDALDPAKAGEHAEAWEKVVRKLRTGAMPPPGRPRPDKALTDSVAASLEAELDRAAAEHPNPGRPTLHRLNRVEYRNAIRDLLALEIDPAALLQGDNAAYGFDNNADALSLSPALTERYLEAAAKISQMALGHVRGSAAPETFFVPSDRNQGVRLGDDQPWGSRGGSTFRYYFPVDGDYQFELQLKESGADGGIVGLTAEPQQLDVSLDRARVWTSMVGGPDIANVRGQERTEKIREALKFRLPIKAGSHLVQVYFVQKTTAFVEDLFDPYLRRDPYRATNGEPGVSSVTIIPPSRGLGVAGPPGRESTASAGSNTSALNDSPTRRRLFVCRPATAADEPGCARTIIAALARRAYRRPVTDDDLQVALARYREGASLGGFESGLELALRSILVSPRFLFRFESQPDTIAPNTAYRIDDLELASRLSFFLWSSTPDDELLNAAAKKTLRQPDVLERQVKRMLSDARSAALVSDFAGQWLHIRNVSGFRPSPEVLFHFDDNLRQAFERETELFVESIIREDRSVLDLLDADYTFLNERLARHYGIPGVFGERFRRVSLPADSVRRGLLGQGSILTDTSRANRTSPVIRGKWILENIFGAPPPSPPANVPDLKEERDPTKILPMREQMAQHRANPGCASCHAQMDELGFALENFDAIGEWRDLDAAGAPIDAAAKLPDGTSFKGPVELRKVLLSHSDDFLTSLTEKLLTYALGRGLEPADAPAVRRVKREAAPAHYSFSALIQGIVTSTPFQMRMSLARAD